MNVVKHVAMKLVLSLSEISKDYHRVDVRRNLASLNPDELERPICQTTR
jgi:hypothetical protein